MTEELKEKLTLWLECCKSFDIFQKGYRQMISRMRLENISRFKRFEEISDKRSRKGKTGFEAYNYFTLDDYSERMELIVGHNHERYELTITNKDLQDIAIRTDGLDENDVDSDCVGLLIVNNAETEEHHMYEVDIVKIGKMYGLVCREYANLQIVNTQTKPLPAEVVRRLSSKDDIKQL